MCRLGYARSQAYTSVYLLCACACNLQLPPAPNAVSRLHSPLSNTPHVNVYIQYMQINMHSLSMCHSPERPSLCTDARSITFPACAAAVSAVVTSV